MIVGFKDDSENVYYTEENLDLGSDKNGDSKNSVETIVYKNSLAVGLSITYEKYETVKDHLVEKGYPKRRLEKILRTLATYLRNLRNNKDKLPYYNSYVVICANDKLINLNYLIQKLSLVNFGFRLSIKNLYVGGKEKYITMGVLKKIMV